MLDDKERYHWGEPMKYFEYSAAGLPVIISDLPAKRALIEKNGNGILVSTINVDDAVDAVKFLIKTPEQAKVIRERGREVFYEIYNWEKNEQRLTGLYRYLLTLE